MVQILKPTLQQSITTMPKHHLQVFTRLKPQSPTAYNTQNISIENESLSLQVPRNKLSNATDYHRFNFNGIFSQDSMQQHIFQRTAMPIIDECMNGYNGTIFAYGQTGSGKTYTMSGDQHWESRGIIPRALNYLFVEIDKNKNINYEVKVSFIEIYNECAYDLLDEKHGEGSQFADWTKIVFLEDEQSNLKLKNMEYHKIKSQSEALNCYFSGTYNRKTSATNLNQNSSRSHCVFTILLKGINLETGTEVFSKIHLIDLAGSQRVSKSLAEGLILNEAKSINLSLSYLEQVIVALNQKAKVKTKTHIPYRNSLLTTLLKDSLGGNCRTVMIATVSSDMTSLDQTLSTLRFAQRVKMVQNEPTINQRNPLSSKMQAIQRQNAMLRRKLQKYEGHQQQQNEQQVTYKIQQYMHHKKGVLDISNLNQAQKYIGRMKQVYRKRMNEYVCQLTFISQKINTYDKVLSKKIINQHKL